MRRDTSGRMPGPLSATASRTKPGWAGPVETAILTRAGLPADQLAQTRDWITQQVPLRRFAQPEEIAAAVLYLCSEESRYVVGSELVVDGGMNRL